MKTIKWIIRVIRSCTRISQLNDTLVLIEQYRLLYSDRCTIKEEIKVLYKAFKSQQKQIIKSI